MLIALISCNGNPGPENTRENTTEKDSSSTTVNANDKDISGCYQLIIEKDTALMKMTSAGDVVSGHLTYKRFEKDSNDGDFTGNIYPNGRMNIWYKFKSEGLISVRQVIFKINENALVEGYGDVTMQHDTAVFKYPTTLAYEENHPFIKVTCP